MAQDNLLPDTSDAVVLDHQALGELRDMMEEAFHDVIETFLDDTATQMQTLRSAEANVDTQTLQRTAHTLQGSSSNIGAVALAQACRDLEASCHAGTIERVATHMAHIEGVYARTRDLLAEIEQQQEA